MTTSNVHVLFICLGNICRSPTAEAVFKREVEEAGLAPVIAIDSAGTGGWHAGELADGRSRDAAARRGVVIDSRARRVIAADFDRFDYLIAMDRSNRDDLLESAPSRAHRGKIHLFRNFDPESRKNTDVPDPYYGGDDGFEQVFDLCVAAARGLLEAVCRDHDLHRHHTL